MRVVDVVDKLFAQCRFSNEDLFRPHNWMRASMRLVRPFQLADPPLPDTSSTLDGSIQIELPPVFPCDVIERPCSTLTSDRPRQYGRRFSGFASSSPESPLSGNCSTSSGNNRSNVTTLTCDTNEARITREQSPESHHGNVNNDLNLAVNGTSSQTESVSHVSSQLSSRHTIPATE